MVNNFVPSRQCLPSRYGATEQAINTIYVLSEKPDQICAAIIKDIAFSIFPQIQPNAPQVNTEHLECSVADLSKFFFVVGHVALKQLVHIEEIHSEIRKRRSAHADKSAANPNQAGSNQQAPAQSRQQGKKDQSKHKLTDIHTTSLFTLLFLNIPTDRRRIRCCCCSRGNRGRAPARNS